MPTVRVYSWQVAGWCPAFHSSVQWSKECTPPPHVSLWFVELNGDGCAPLTKCLALSEDLFDTKIIFKKLVWGPSPCNTRHNNLVKGNGIRFQEPASSLFLGCYEKMGPLAAACKLTINIPWTATRGGSRKRRSGIILAWNSEFQWVVLVLKDIILSAGAEHG